MAVATPVGWTLPRIRHIPKGKRSTEMCRVAVELAAETGLILDEWQEYILQHSLRQRECLNPRCQLHAKAPGHSHWAALEVGLSVPRQNGKGGVLEARELFALYCDRDKWPEVACELVVHSAHEAKTAHEHFERLWNLIRNTPRLVMRVKGKPTHSMGGESITLWDGRRIQFATRTSGGTRGFSCDLLVLDEAMVLSQAAHRAMFPTVSARPNAQIWYTGSAVDQETMADGLVFSRVRKRGMAKEGGIAYFEWSLEHENPDEVTDEEASNPDLQAIANPGYGIRLHPEIIAIEQRSLDSRGFAVERLGVGDWPDPESASRVIDPEKWTACEDAESIAKDPVCFAFDVSPDRAKACISAAGWRADGRSHVEVIDHRRGTGWVAAALVALRDAHRPTAIVCDARGAAGALLPALEQDHGLTIIPVTANEHGRGCGIFFDAVEQNTLRHLGQKPLNAAVAGAAKRPLTGAWAWDKMKSSVDITPIVSGTLALFALYEYRRQRPPEIIALNELEEEEEDIAASDLPPLDPEDL